MAKAHVEGAGNGNWVIEGELDFTTVPALLNSAGTEFADHKLIRVDLKGVTRADSAGLALLVEWLRAAECSGTNIKFVNVPEQMMSMARVCGLDTILPFHKIRQV